MNPTEMTEDLTRIFHQKLHVAPWRHAATRKLPGVNPLSWDDWLLKDEAYDAQMAYRDQLVETQKQSVFLAQNDAIDASNELLQMVTTQLKNSDGYTVSEHEVVRPDGQTVDLKSDHPLIVSGRLVQQDFCLMERGPDEHVLRAGILCFPSNWRLSAKIGLPMSGIHEPVDVYDAQIAQRVQRIFDHITPANPVWRANFLYYASPNLHQPNREVEVTRQTGKWVRVERQSLVKLPRSGYLCFGIHTHIVNIETLQPADAEAFLTAWENHYRVPVTAPKL